MLSAFEGRRLQFPYFGLLLFELSSRLFLFDYIQVIYAMLAIKLLQVSSLSNIPFFYFHYSFTSIIKKICAYMHLKTNKLEIKIEIK